MRGAVVLFVLLLACATPKPLHELRQSDVQDAIVSHKSELGHCVAEQRQRDPASRGKILLRFRILPSGVPSGFESPSGGPPELVRCLTRVLSEVRFPTSEVPGDPITYPLQY